MWSPFFILSSILQSKFETQFFIIGFPFFSRLYSISLQSGFFFAKLFDINCCFLLNIFIVIFSDFLKIFNLVDLLSSENNTRGGDRDKEEKEFIVFPYNIEL